jgi:Mg-chelatase subunit ChlD
MSFSTPAFLLLLLTLPVFVWLGWPARGPSRRREIVSLLLRLLIALLLVLSLAGLEVRQTADELSVVFLVDNSDSMSPAAKQLAHQFVQAALQHLGPGDRAGVILFGAEALVERPLSSSQDLGSFTSKVTPLQTNLAEAIRLGLALLPADTARRLVILSDGQETTGDALAAAQLARASGAQIVVIPFVQTGSAADALVSAVEAPAHLRQGEQFSLQVTVDSTTSQAAGVRVFSGGAVAYEGTLNLHSGANHFDLPLTAGAPGFANYQVQISPQQDAFYQNDEMAAFADIAGPPKVLLIKNPAPRDQVDESRELIAALTSANIQVQVVTPAGLPTELPVLAEYASVILVDVPAPDLSPRQMTSLQTYVRDLGGGLVAVGGPTSYGVGGYFRTPLEETLPVEMQIKDQKRRAKLTIVFVIDHSGSMSETSGGVQKVDLAKEAVIRSIDFLSPSDKVGVVAFDDSASWVVPITPLDNPDKVKNLVGTIRADGGTDILAAVRAVAAVLPNDDSNIRHIILLTDGGADPTGIPELVASMNKNYGITFSTVGVGQDAAPFLADLAKAGNGLYHFTADPSTIPTIFAEETTLATRAYIIENEFFPQATGPHPILQGITSVPKLLGYVGTSPKDAAQTILVSDQKDPILAAWRYGLGKSVAWTSDATGRWAKNWVSWDQFARFWAQVVRYSLSEGTASNTQVTVNPAGSAATLTVDAQSAAGAYLNGLTLQANVVGPDGQTQTTTLSQVAPGRYEGAFTPAAEGAYVIRVAGQDPAQPAGAQATVAQTAGWVLSYSPEYRPALSADPNQPAGSQLLLRLANATGGSALKSNADGSLALADLFKHDLTAPARGARPIWPWLLGLAALLLPFDIAVRRLVVTRYDLQRAWHKAWAWLAERAPQLTPKPTPRTEQLSALFQVKTKVQDARRSEPGAPEASAPLPPPPSAPGPSAPLASPPPTAAPAPATTSAALLAAKKRAQGKKD